MSNTSANFKNRTLFHGDNLDFLRAMNSQSVDLIATDPPFNKGRDFHATPDSLAKGASFQDRWSWKRDVHESWLDQINDDWPQVMEAIENSRKTYGDDMGAFLCFMAVRLIGMRRVLKDSGSIYLHCDPTASHYLKMVMDGIFGRKNFINEVIWHYESGGRAKNFLPKKHDVLFWYAKNHKKKVFNGDAISIPRNGCSLCGQKLEKWNNLKKNVDKDGRVYRTIKSAGKEYRYYDDEPVLPSDVWLGINHLQQKDPERTGYPTQKPLALYERIIQASSKKGDMVLDPFCGCATTPIAAERLGRQWVGIDIWKTAHKQVIDRLTQEGLISPEGKKTGLFNKGQIHLIETPPERTDEGETDAPYMVTVKKVYEPEGSRMSRAQMVDFLIEQNGMKCQGCDRTFDDPRYLELDHNTPRADGGINHISNRILLCGPCNKVKSNTLTLSGLRRMNKKNGHMVV